MKYGYKIILLFTLESCFLKVASLKITDKYILVKKPGQSFALSKIEPLAMDSIFGYPTKEKLITTYNLRKRSSNNNIDENENIKVHFHEKNSKYKWMIYKDYTDINKIYSDTISLAPKVWYNLYSYNCSYELYFYWTGKEGDFIIKEKPKHGAW